MKKLSLRRRQRHIQLSLFPDFDLGTVRSYIQDIARLKGEKEAVKRQAEFDLRQIDRQIKRRLRNIRELVRSNWSYFFAGKRYSELSGGALGWSQPRPLVVLKGKDKEIVDRLRSQYSYHIKEVPDRSSLVNDLRACRAIGAIIKPRSAVLWVRVRGEKLFFDLKGRSGKL